MRILLILTLLVLSGCSPARPSVRQWGGLRSVLRDGQTQGRVSLVGAVGPTTVGVGALAGLEGEITILDGRAWIARRRGETLAVSGAARADRAALLTTAEVSAWHETALAVPGSPEGAAADDAIAAAAAAEGIDTGRPFPFTISGEFVSLDLHVVHGGCPIAHPDLPPERQPWRWSADGHLVRATLVGFYALDAAGVMTHHGTSVHVHAVVELEGETIVGHVERFALPSRATLGLPVGEPWAR